MRRLRKQRGITQIELARQANVKSSSTISRLESGLEDHVSRDLITKLAEPLGDQGELWAAAGALPAEAMHELARLWRAYQAEYLYERTLPTVRRAHHAAIAQQLLDNAPGAFGDGARAVPERIAAALTPNRRTRVVVGGDQPPALTVTSNEIVITRRKPNINTPGPDTNERDSLLARHLIVHGIAHVLLADDPAAPVECAWPKNTQTEADADDVASHLLIPPPVLRSAFSRATDSTHPDSIADGWSADTAGIIDYLANQLGAPTWVVVRRVAEDDLLNEHAQGASL